VRKCSGVIAYTRQWFNWQTWENV